MEAENRTPLKAIERGQSKVKKNANLFTGWEDTNNAGDITLEDILGEKG
jgi:hypothetical protein